MNAGAATFGNGTTGISGAISVSNSLVGTSTDDMVGTIVHALPNGNYVVTSYLWNNGGVIEAGAVTFGDGTSGIAGPVTVRNSLVGSNAYDNVGNNGVSLLTNGNYVVMTPFWNNGGVTDAGAVTFASGTSGIAGPITAANSLVGTQPDDLANSWVTPLANGNYVVASSRWDNGAATDAGAVTFASGLGGVSGEVTLANSLVGTTSHDRVGSRVVALTNGNYVVSSANWDNGAAIDAGMATFGDGTVGTTGVVSAANSLIGTTSSDRVGVGLTALTNGNYVVRSYHWNNGAATNAGAFTFGNGLVGVSGAVSTANSLVGTSNDDLVGRDVKALSNGNYVVVNYYWDNGALANAGAVTFGNGTAGVSGEVDAANSLVGLSADTTLLFSMDDVNDHFFGRFLDEDGGRVRVGSQLDGVAPTTLGDAPDTNPGTGPNNYQTLHSDNGPRQHFDSRIFLGATIDGESAAQASAAANGDDANGAGADDEDGLNNPLGDLTLTVGGVPSVNVIVTNTTGIAGTLSGWIDYNANGVFDNATERAQVAVPHGSSGDVVTLTFPVVPFGFNGQTYARFRLSTDAAGTESIGFALNGEVEDYAATILDPSTGTVVSEQKISDTAGTFTGVLDNSDAFGDSMAAVGDLNGDGTTDLVVGASSDDDGGSARGAVWVLFMAANGAVQTHQKISDTDGGFTGTLDDNDQFGGSVASLGDLDGDGITDIAVGADGDDDGGSGRGAVWVLFLNSNGTVKSHQKISDTAGNFTGVLGNADELGTSVTALGDLDSDGITDLAVGAAADDDGGTNRGAVWVLFLNADGTVKSHQKISATQGDFNGTLLDGDFFGSSVANLGDQNGDGILEFAVGAIRDDDGGSGRGAVWILSLKENGVVSAFQKISATQGGFTGTLDNNDSFGASVASVGDLDGDGVTDLAVGATFDDDGGVNTGAVWVLFLNANGTVKSHQKISDTAGNFGGTLTTNDFFGDSVSFLGDLDGDGITELAVGATGDDDGGTGRGAIYVLNLQADVIDELNLLTAPARVPGNVVAVEQGTGLALVPDVNDNGVSVFANASGGIVIRGLAGTTVNGAAEAVLFPGGGGVTGTFRVLASTGTMLTAIDGLSVGGLEIFGGMESEALELSHVTIGANLTVNLTDGDNSMLFTNGSGAVSKSTLVTGSGSDIVRFRNATSGTINNLDTGAGSDTVSMRDSTFAGSLALTTGAGNDTVTGNVVSAAGSMRVNTGDNSDNIDLDQWTAANQGIVEPGDGNDTATISNSNLNGLFFVNLGTGNNTFTSTASTFQTSINVNTLPGNHDINFTGGNMSGATFINAFNGTSHVDIDGITTSSIFVVRTAVSGDTVDIINSNFSDTLNISTNGGIDDVTVSGTQVDKQFFLDTFTGADTVSLNTTTVLQDLFVNTGNGGDTISLDQVSVTLQTALNAGQATDDVTITNSNFGTLTNINTGIGNDNVDVTGSDFAGGTSINTDDGSDIVTGSNVTSAAAFTIDTGANNDVIDLNLFTPSQPLTIQPGSGNDAVRLMNFPTSNTISIAPTSGNNVIDLQANTFGNHVTVATTNAHLALRHKSNSFTTASFIAGTAANDDVFLENGTSTFNSPPAVFNFDDLTNNLIDELFEDLLGLAFP